MEKKLKLKSLADSAAFRLSLMILLLYLASGILSPVYFSYDHIMSLLVLCSFLGIISIGQTFVILSGGIDLSVSYTIAFVACVFGQTMKNTGSEIAAFSAAMFAALLTGLFKGFGVAVLKFPSMIMTLAASSVLMSVTFLYTGGVLKGSATEFITAIVKQDIAGIRYCVLVWLALGLLAIWILRKTTFGRSIYAIGSNPRVAQLSGINTRLVLMGVYVYESLMMALAAILLVGYIGYPNYTMGDGYQLMSVTSVVVGGTSIMGGQGGYGGTMGGVIVIYLIQSVLILLNIGEAGREIVYGAIILVILLAYGRGKKFG